MGIRDEFESSKKYMLETKKPFVSKKGTKITLIELTLDNVAKVEAMVRNDSSYKKSFDVNAGPIKNKNGKEVYSGSTAYWMTKLKSIIEGKENNLTYDDIIPKVVRSIDRENSTHLNSDGCGIEVISKRIVDLGKDQLIDSLKEGNLVVFEKIQEKTKPNTNPNNNGNKKYKGRENTSFASKFCHYACFFLFEEEELRDKYSIYDKVIASVLPYYMEKYGVEYSGDLTKYSVYRNVIDLIRDKVANSEPQKNISRNGFDHLLWYYHKGR